MSVSEQPRLADRQPSFRGGVPRVKTWHRTIRFRCKRGPYLFKALPAVSGGGLLL